MGNLEGEFGEEMLSFLGEMMLNEEDGLAMGETGEGWVPAMPRLGQRVSRWVFVGYRSVIQSLWCIACEPEVGIVGMVNQIPLCRALSWLPPSSQPTFSLPSIPCHCTVPNKNHKIQVIVFVFHCVLTIFLISCFLSFVMVILCPSLH